MANYKVPQDVEAEDKLLGPLTFKQFIFMLIAAGAGLMTWFMYQISPFMAIIPLPFVLIFGGLAVLRREDQPIERYLLSF
ncbi:MAG: PrgI family protein, partial [Candidatus Saccharimonadales bacterium]